MDDAVTTTRRLGISTSSSTSPTASCVAAADDKHRPGSRQKPLPQRILGRDLDRLTALIEAGQVTTPHVDRTYPLDELPAAMSRLIAGEVRGKIAITI